MILHLVLATYRFIFLKVTSTRQAIGDIKFLVRRVCLVVSALSAAKREVAGSNPGSGDPISTGPKCQKKKKEKAPVYGALGARRRSPGGRNESGVPHYTGVRHSDIVVFDASNTIISL